MSSLAWKRRLGRLFGGKSAAGRGVVLIYHSVAGGPLSTAAESFREQMAWLAENADVVSLEALLASREPSQKQGKPQVALTFDDGYRTVHDVALPILRQHGFAATVYLNSGHIGDDQHQPSNAGIGHYPAEFFMNWNEVVHLQASGWTIGSHGVEHLDLTRQDENVVMEQLTASRKNISAVLGEECRHFSYTWGRYNSAVRAMVGRAGYKTAVAGRHAPIGRHSDLLALPRLDVRREYSIGDFSAVVRGDWDYLGAYQSLRALI